MEARSYKDVCMTAVFNVIKVLKSNECNGSNYSAKSKERIESSESKMSGGKKEVKRGKKIPKREIGRSKTEGEENGDKRG